MTSTSPLPYLERRPGGFLYRRRIPGRAGPVRPAAGPGPDPRAGSPKKKFLRLSLRTHVPSEARILAMRLTALFDLAFALETEQAMDHLRPDQIDMLEALARIQIAAHAAVRAAAPLRSEAAARQAAACEQATQAVLRRALVTGDRELARQPLREVATCLGLALLEDTEDWNRLAFEATRVLLDASRLREREELGEFEEPSPVFRTARARMEGLVRPQGTASSVPAPTQLTPAPAALPISHATQAARPAPVVQPALPVAHPVGAPAVSAPTPSEVGPASDPIGHSVKTPEAAPSDPACAKLALRLEMHPPRLDTLPLDRLSPGIMQVLRDKPRGITLTEAIQLFDELKTLGCGSEFGKLQEFDEVAGRNWVRDSRSKTRFALQFWPEFVGDGPFEEVDTGAIRDALEAPPRIPKKHGKGVQDWGSQHSFEDLIERSDAWEEHVAAENLACLSRDATEADREKATLLSMRVFARVVELGGFSAAARACGMSPGMVAKHVAHLEDRTGVRLLDRTTRSVRATPEGQSYLERVLAILDAVEEAEGSVGAESRDARGTLRLTAPVELGQRHLAPLLVAFMERHPRITVLADFTNWPVDLVQEGIDLAIRVAPSLDTALIGRKLATTRFCIVASPDYLSRHGTPEAPGALSTLSALTFSQPAPRLEWGWRRGDDAGTIRIAPRLLSRSAETLRIATISGLGVSWLPTFICGDDLSHGHLVPILTEWDGGTLGVFALYPHKRFVPSRLRLFLDFLAAQLGRDPDADPWMPRMMTR